MELNKLLNHLDGKNFLNPTKADPTIPPSLNLPEGDQSDLLSSRIDLDKIMKQDYSELTREDDWLEQNEIKPPNPNDLPNPEEEKEIAIDLGGPSLDVLGWYCPFHYYLENYGIYIKSKTIETNTRALINLMTHDERSKYCSLSSSDKLVFSQEIKRASFLSIFNHEMYHHSIESFATRLEMVNDRAYFCDYSKKIYKLYQQPLHDNLIEEGLATAYPLRYFRQNAKKLFKKFPNNLSIGDIICRFEFKKILHCTVPGYRRATDLLQSHKIKSVPDTGGISNSLFGKMQRELQQTILECKYIPSGDQENWRYAPLMMKPYFDRNIIAYEVLDHRSFSPILPSSIHLLQLSPRKAVKIARKNWNIIIDGEGRGDHKKVKLPVSKKRIDFDMGYPNIPRKEWGILIEGMNEVLGSNYRPNEEGRKKFINGP